MNKNRNTQEIYWKAGLAGNGGFHGGFSRHIRFIDIRFGGDMGDVYKRQVLISSAAPITLIPRLFWMLATGRACAC